MAKRIVLDKEGIRKKFLQYNAELADKAIKPAKKELQAKKKHIKELSRLMQVSYEDKVKGKIPEDVCIGFIEKYAAEQKDVIERLEATITQTEVKETNADDFIKNIKKYVQLPALTRDVCYELIAELL